MKPSKHPSTSLDTYSAIDRWQHEDSSDDPNVFASLFHKLTRYEQAFRQQSSLSKHEIAINKDKDKDQGAIEQPIVRIKSLTTEISVSKKRQSLPNRPPHMRRKLSRDHDCMSVQEVAASKRKGGEELKENSHTNVSSQMLIGSRKRHNESLNMKINNVKFDRLSSNYVKKRDRYRQIFGEKPKYIYKRIGGEEKISLIPHIKMR